MKHNWQLFQTEREGKLVYVFQRNCERQFFENGATPSNQLPIERVINVESL